MRAASGEYRVPTIWQTPQNGCVVMGQSALPRPAQLSSLRVKPSQEIPCVFTAAGMLWFQWFHIQDCVTYFDGFILLVERTSEGGGPSSRPDWFAIDRPTSHAAAGVPAPDVFSIRDRCGAATAAEAVRIDALG